MVYKYSPGTIYNIIHESDLVRRFFFKIPDETPFSFKAGQFVMLHLPIDSKYKNRSYSIASAPNDENTFELAIILNPRGLGTPYLWENVELGAQVDVSKPLGKFHVETPIENDICFICTGTGIAPLRSMLVDILNKNIPCRNLYMIFGNRFEKDILYRREMEELQDKHPNFKFIPVLSRENDAWKGEKGYVHHIYEKIFEDRRSATFYLCGWKEMLRETRTRLEAMGYDKSRIKFESYD